MGNISEGNEEDLETQDKVERTVSRYNQKLKKREEKKHSEFLQLKKYFKRFRELIYDVIVYQILNRMIDVNFLPIQGSLKVDQFYGYFRDDPRRKVYLIFRSFRFVSDKQLNLLPIRSLSLHMNPNYTSSSKRFSRFKELERLDGFDGKLSKIGVVDRLVFLRIDFSYLNKMKDPLPNLEILLLEGEIKSKDGQKNLEDHRFPKLRKIKIISNLFDSDFYYDYYSKKPKETERNLGLDRILRMKNIPLTHLLLHQKEHIYRLKDIDVDNLSKFKNLQVLSLSGTVPEQDKVQEFKDKLTENRESVLSVRIVDRHWDDYQLFGQSLLDFSNELIHFSYIEYNLDF